MIDDDREADELTAKVNAAFRQTVLDVIQAAKRAGTPIILWKDGRIVEVSAEEVEMTISIGPQAPSHG